MFGGLIEAFRWLKIRAYRVSGCLGFSLGIKIVKVQDLQGLGFSTLRDLQGFRVEGSGLKTA